MQLVNPWADQSCMFCDRKIDIKKLFSLSFSTNNLKSYCFTTPCFRLFLAACLLLYSISDHLFRFLFFDGQIVTQIVGIAISDLNLMGLFSTERGKRDLENYTDSTDTDSRNRNQVGSTRLAWVNQVGLVDPPPPKEF